MRRFDPAAQRTALVAVACTLWGCALPVETEALQELDPDEGPVLATPSAAQLATYQRYSLPYTDEAGVRLTRRRLQPSAAYVCGLVAIGGPTSANRIVR